MVKVFDFVQLGGLKVKRKRSWRAPSSTMNGLGLKMLRTNGFNCSQNLFPHLHVWLTLL